MPQGPHYAIRLNLPTETDIDVGALGAFSFPPGDYVYIGRAKSGFDARLSRHRRTDDKTIRWHVDYLRDRARWVEARTPDTDSECALADRIASLPGAERFIDGFGASDCRCKGHLVRLSDPTTDLPGPLWSGDGVRAHFVERPNRFIVRADLTTGETVRAYLPNTSRLTELLEGEPEMLLEPNDDATRSTDYTVRRIWDGVWVSVEATVAEQMVEQWLERHRGLPEIGAVDTWSRQETHDDHRFDFLLQYNNSDDLWLEVKSLSRCFDGDAILSGTPSRRAVAHLESLGDLAESGTRAALAFVLQRPDPRRLLIGEGPDSAEVNQDWIASVRRARDRGVTVLAFRCRVTPTNAWLAEPIPVLDVGENHDRPTG